MQLRISLSVLSPFPHLHTRHTVFVENAGISLAEPKQEVKWGRRHGTSGQDTGVGHS